MYIHELEAWPKFRWGTDRLAEALASVRHRQGRVIGRMETLGFDLRREAVLETLTCDVVKSSEIEGEELEAEQVRSSIARRLGMDAGALRPPDRHVEGIVEIMLDATGGYEQALTAERLFGWHAALFLQLVERGLLVRGPAGGRSTSYALALTYRAGDRGGHGKGP